MDYSYESLMSLNGRDFGESTKRWDECVRTFWKGHSDRLYEFYVLPGILGIKGDSSLVEIGAEYYSKYIRSVLGITNGFFCLIDKKPKDHYDIRNVLNVDLFLSADLTSSINFPIPTFDFVISFGVLSHYDFSLTQCVTYVQNTLKMMKNQGACAIKIDVQVVQKIKDFKYYNSLLHIIESTFVVYNLDRLYDINHQLQFIVYYCKKKEA